MIVLKIKFDRKEKNIDEQYKILRQKYIKVRKLIQEHNCNVNSNNHFSRNYKIGIIAGL